MLHRLSLREKSVIVGGVVFLVLFMIYALAVSPLRQRIKDSEKRKSDLEIIHREIDGANLVYDELVNERDQLKKKLLDRDPNFDLSQEIARINTALNFKIDTLKPHSERKKLKIYAYYGADVRYQNKTIEEIVSYLYEIEKPEYAIIVKSFRIMPQKKRDLLNFNIDLYSVGLIGAEAEEGS